MIYQPEQRPYFEAYHADYILSDNEFIVVTKWEAYGYCRASTTEELHTIPDGQNENKSCAIRIFLW
jgi:hypothetical protein